MERICGLFHKVPFVILFLFVIILLRCSVCSYTHKGKNYYSRVEHSLLIRFIKITQSNQLYPKTIRNRLAIPREIARTREGAVLTHRDITPSPPKRGPPSSTFTCKKIMLFCHKKIITHNLMIIMTLP